MCADLQKVALSLQRAMLILFLSILVSPYLSATDSHRFAFGTAITLGGASFPMLFRSLVHKVPKPCRSSLGTALFPNTSAKLMF